MNNGLLAILFGVAAIAGGAGWYSWYQNNQQNIEKQGKIEQLDRESATYRNKISDLEKQLQQLTEKTRAIAAAQTPTPAVNEDQQRVASLRQEVATLQSAQETRVKEFEQLKQEQTKIAAAQTQEIQRLTSLMTANQETIAKLTEQAQSQGKTATDLAAQADAEKQKYQDEKQALEKTIADLTAAQTRLQTELNNPAPNATPGPATAVDEKVAALTQQLAEKESRIQELVQQMAAGQTMIGGLESQIQDMRDLLKKMSGNTALEAKIAELTTAIKAREAAPNEQNALTQQIQELTKRLEQTSDAVSLQNKITELTATLSERDIEKAQLQMQIQQATLQKDDLTKQRQQAEDAVQKKDQELLALQQAKATLEKTNAEQGTTIRQLTQKLDETAAATQTDAASKTQEIAALQAKIHAVEQQNVDLKTQSDAAIAALQTETQTLTAKLSQAEAELAALRQAKDQAEAQANTAEATIAKLQQEAQQTAATLNESQNKLAVSEENLAAREAEYQAKIVEHNQMITKLKEDIENGVVEKDSIQKRLQDEVDKSKADYQQRLEELAAAKEQEIEQLRTMAETYQNLSKNLEKEISEKTVTIEQIQEKLSVKIVDKILFATGKAEINANGIRLLKTVGDSLKTSLEGREIRIEGHTDNRPIVSGITAKYPTNWELSTARAVNVVKYLEQAVKIEPRKLEAVGYGPNRPIADNTTEEGRALNRRIEIILTPELEREPVQ